MNSRCAAASRAVLSTAGSLKDLSIATTAATAAFRALEAATRTVTQASHEGRGGHPPGRVIFWPGAGSGCRQVPSPATFAKDQLRAGHNLVPPGTGRLLTVAIIAKEYEQRYSTKNRTMQGNALRGAYAGTNSNRQA